MQFTQPAPVLGNQYHDDRVLRAYLARVLPPATNDAVHADLEALGQHAAQAWNLARSRPAHQPVLTRWDAWGERVDCIESTPVWNSGAGMTTRFGLVAAGHESTHGAHGRVDQFARVYLHHVASEFYTCPLAMSDAAAVVLKSSAERALIDRTLPRLLARDPAKLWISGQWMTETGGGSDVGNTETSARTDAEGRWRLYGRKWFVSAVVGDMALTLARPEGAVGGADALALFYLETRDADRRWNGIHVERLKDKLGTRELPTAEIELDGTLATPLGELAHGVRRITPMLNITRTWNAVCALATMRRCLALAIDHAARRHAFGRALIDQPLHRATLASTHAQFEAAFQLVFFVAELLGRSETGTASDDERTLLRLLTPLAKLWTGKLAVHIASETCEAFGGAGYIENTGIPQLLRDAQVYPIWEGTTNVLALDVLRALGTSGIDPLVNRARALLDEAGDDRYGITAALGEARRWLDASAGSRDALQTGARALSLTLARGFAGALLARHAAWARRERADARADAALALFAGTGLSRLQTAPAMDAVATVLDNTPT